MQKLPPDSVPKECNDEEDKPEELETSIKAMQTNIKEIHHRTEETKSDIQEVHLRNPTSPKAGRAGTQDLQPRILDREPENDKISSQGRGNGQDPIGRIGQARRANMSLKATTNADDDLFAGLYDK